MHAAQRAAVVTPHLHKMGVLRLQSVVSPLPPPSLGGSDNGVSYAVI